MKTLFLAAMFACLYLPLSAQKDTSDADKWGDAVAALYAQTDPATTYIERLGLAFKNLLLDERRAGTAFIAGLEQKTKLPIDSVVKIFSDSALASYTRNHLWDEAPGANEKYGTFFQAYADKMCPCITEKINKAPRGMLSIEELNNCIQAMAADTGYINMARSIASRLTIAEQQAVSNQASWYLFQHCHAVYKMMTKSIYEETSIMYLDNEEGKLRQLTKTVGEYLQKNDPRLKEIFPDYKKYVADITAVNKIQTQFKPNLYGNKQENKNGQLYRSDYLYTKKNGKLTLFGELSYTAQRLPTLKLVMFQFIPVAKMKDAEKVKKLFDTDVAEPPPAMEELREVTLPPPGKKQ